MNICNCESEKFIFQDIKIDKTEIMEKWNRRIYKGKTWSNICQYDEKAR